MKISHLTYLAIAAILYFAACSSDSSDGLNHSRVIYTPTGCCSNLYALDQVNTPDTCGSPYQLLYGINLDEFEIKQNYSFGDTIAINFNFKNECEAESDEYDCPIVCDKRHGSPIYIISID